jgi:transcriptional regulator with XRE-family HTH domain
MIAGYVADELSLRATDGEIVVQRGRKGNEARRREAAKLRAQGWTVQRIADYLGVTHQRVSRILKAAGVPLRAVRCRECGTTILDRAHGAGVRASVWCLACLRQHPEAPFGERVKAARLAAGFTQRQVAKQLGIDHSISGKLEARRGQPDQQLRAALVQLFATALADV